MSSVFDGYHVWLGIPPTEQPPNHYRLLGISVFETDLDVIDHAADRQMAHVRTFQTGRHGSLSQQILNELAAARLCLLSSDKKAAYDEQLRQKVGRAAKGVPLARAVPVAPAATAARVQPKAVAAAVPSVPYTGDLLESLDSDPASDSFATGAPLGKLHVKRRSNQPSWRSAAILGTLAGVVVSALFMLYFLVNKVESWEQIWQVLITPPAVESAPASEPVKRAAPAPAAPHRGET